MLFNFEMDFATSLRCIPMIVRMKLDLCGVKLSLRQWCRFTRQEREILATLSVTTLVEEEAYREFLLRLIRARTGEEPKLLPSAKNEPWQVLQSVPEAIRLKAKENGLQAPTSDQWQHLSPLQRFALVKLTRSGHENQNFAPALKEFLGVRDAYI
ncbi:nitrate reductase associated protein [Acetobacter pasteurianus]